MKYNIMRNLCGEILRAGPKSLFKGTVRIALALRLDGCEKGFDVILLMVKIQRTKIKIKGNILPLSFEGF